VPKRSACPAWVVAFPDLLFDRRRNYPSAFFRDEGLRLLGAEAFIVSFNRDELEFKNFAIVGGLLPSVD